MCRVAVAERVPMAFSLRCCECKETSHGYDCCIAMVVVNARKSHAVTRKSNSAYAISDMDQTALLLKASRGVDWMLDVGWCWVLDDIVLPS